MAESKNFSAEAGSAKVVGTVSSADIAEPVAPPMGLRAMGPRITFHFVGEWDAETSYVLYDVVRVNGTSYIANKISIAKGINPETDNEVHWVKWNDPNAQVELLQQTVNGFDARITAAETEATNAAADATEAKNASADNTAAISAETTRATAAEEANANAISAEATRAKAAEAANAAAIKTEVAAIAPKFKIEDFIKNNFVYSILTIPRNNISKIQTREMPTNTKATRLRDFYYENEGKIIFNGLLLRKDLATYVTNGKIVKPFSSTNETGWCAFGFNIENNPIYLDNLDGTMPASAMVAAGMHNGGLAFSAIRLNGRAFDTSKIPDSSVKTDICNGKHPRTLFGWDDENYYVITVCGRHFATCGMSYNDMAYEFSNIPNLVNLDGGHNSACFAQSPNNMQYYASSEQNLLHGTDTTAFVIELKEN